MTFAIPDVIYIYLYSVLFCFFRACARVLFLLLFLVWLGLVNGLHFVMVSFFLSILILRFNIPKYLHERVSYYLHTANRFECFDYCC